ncbi:glycosyltransferase family 25 protein [Daldinia sp. FL1419]|nr:glycosyltransferase family 25 protein [Daldinia sp. FL1419]
MSLAGTVSNLTFTWLDGVSASQISNRDALVGGGIRSSSGAKGSWRSHMNALSPPSMMGRRVNEDTAIDPEAGTDSNIQTSYGDDWDILWLGHCGADFPDAQSPIPALRIEIPGDETVPVPKHLKPHPFALKDKLGELYPPHTRVVHASSGNVCTLAYAVSHQGARKLLSQFDDHYDAQWDLMLQRWCEGKYTTTDKLGVCLTVQPPLFSHHYAKGGASNILSQGGGYAKGTGTPYIRLSVRQNIDRLVAGAREGELVDQLPDDGDPIWK